MSIESEVISKIKPTQEDVDKLQKVCDSLMKEILDYLSSHSVSAKVRYVGSVAKGTFLNDPDLDVFILFPETYPEKEMEEFCLEMGKDLINGAEMYAEHPYSSGIYRGYEVDMVPCYDIPSTDKLMTAVDRSPFHADYIRSHTDERMRDEIRLMKRFMKGIGTYGAEPNVRGFSGYMCELITLYYGGFRESLEAASKWREGTVITLEETGPPMKAPLVTYDPVDAKRNVASAVHIDTMCLFITAAREYLKAPSMRFFYPEERVPLSSDSIREFADAHGTRLVTVSFSRPDIIEDNLHAQVWRTRYGLEKKLNMFSFNVLRAAHHTGDDRITIVFEVERDVLPRTYRHSGPPVWVRSSDSFLAKWSDNRYGGPFIENGYWVVIADRQYWNIPDMIRGELGTMGIGKDMDPSSMEILSHEDTLSDTGRSLLTELLDPRPNWEN